MYNRVTLGALYLLYVVPCALKDAWALQSPVWMIIIPVILLTSPFIAFFGDRATILAELEEAVGGSIRNMGGKEEKKQPQQGWLRENPKPSFAWIAPIE